MLVQVFVGTPHTLVHLVGTARTAALPGSRHRRVEALRLGYFLTSHQTSSECFPHGWRLQGTCPPRNPPCTSRAEAIGVEIQTGDCLLNVYWHRITFGPHSWVDTCPESYGQRQLATLAAGGCVQGGVVYRSGCSVAKCPATSPKLAATRPRFWKASGFVV